MKTTKKLSLGRETLRRLDPKQMSGLAGAATFLCTTRRACSEETCLCSQYSCPDATCGCATPGCATQTIGW